MKRERGWVRGNLAGGLKLMTRDCTNVRQASSLADILLGALNHKPEARDCLRDLFVTDPFDDKNALKRKKGDRARGTCEWILGIEELTVWLGSEPTADPLLWLHGNPGTGKSTMAIFLAEELSTSFSSTDGKSLAYFFCDSANDTRKTASYLGPQGASPPTCPTTPAAARLPPAKVQRAQSRALQVIRRSLDSLHGPRG